MKTSNQYTLLLAFLAGLSCCAALFYAGQVAAMSGAVSVRWGSGGLSPAQLSRQEEYARQDQVENWPETTLWQESKDQVVSDGDARSQRADLLWLYGSGDAVISGKLLAGAFPARSDPEGCAVSEAMANALWGGIDVLGMPLHLDGKVYYVRGVFGGSGTKVLLQREGSSVEAMPYLELIFSDGGGREQAETFLNRINAGEATILDQPLLAWAITLLAGLPGFALAVRLLGRLLSRGAKLRAYPVLLAGYGPLFLLGTLTTIWAMGLPVIPARLLPTRWSDFDFWTQQVRSFATQLGRWFSGAFVGEDGRLLVGLLAVLLLTFLGTGFLLAAAGRVQVRSYRQLVVSTLAFMAGFWLISLLLYPLEA